MSVDKKFQKLTDIDHTLLRPSMYIGSIKPHKSNKWLPEDGKMTQSEITYNPGFLKLFDEILSNSVDESKRKGSKLNTIKVDILRDVNQICIWDNGGIPVVKHSEHKEWIPEMVFSNLRSGGNFDDTEERSWAGTNGVGSTITNIFSLKFEVSTCDGVNQFNQMFTNNMRDRTSPKIKKSTKGFTEISYIPDLKRFDMESIDDSNYKMIEKRIYDIAACNPKLKIYFNGDIINIKSFEDYIKMYTDADEYIFETNKDKSWSIGISNSNNGFQQVSFVNSTDTYDGGTHIDYIMNQIISSIREFFLKKHKVDVKPSEIKNHMFIFLNSTVINPSFSSQTKEKLITEVKDFGSTFSITDRVIKLILKSEIVNSILDWIEQKKNAEENKLARELKKKIKVEKLIDCHSRLRNKCDLFIMEGLSAVGDFRKYRNPETQAAYSLKGKFVNTNGMSNVKIIEKEEAKNLIQSIGLDLFNRKDISGIRYGRIIITSDMDTDGDSICGLLLNFFSMWPDLFSDCIIYRALTPLLVIKPKNEKDKSGPVYFYNYDEYNKWLEKNSLSKYELDYKKGLGSLESDEFKELIQNTRLIKFISNEDYIVDVDAWFGDDSALRKNKIVGIDE